MAADPAIALSARDLRKSYGARMALDGLSLEVRSGEIFGLLGPNGAGKTTLMAIVSGLMRPDAGQVDIAGHGPPQSPSARAQLGLAPQELALYPGLSARENLEFFAGLHGLAGGEKRTRVAWTLEFVGLETRAEDRASSFSGGMQRRLNLAIALLHRPGLLLLDEPTVGVDPQSRNLLLEKVGLLRASGHTIVYASHHMHEVEQICDRVAIVDHGRLLALGSVPELVAQHAPGQVLKLVCDGQTTSLRTTDPLAELQRRALGGRVSEFSARSASLEEVFLQLTGRELRDT